MKLLAILKTPSSSFLWSFHSHTHTPRAYVATCWVFLSPGASENEPCPLKHPLAAVHFQEAPTSRDTAPPPPPNKVSCLENLQSSAIHKDLVRW